MGALFVALLGAMAITGEIRHGTIRPAIGVSVGAVVRNQMLALIGIPVWLLFVENLLFGDIAGADDVGRL